MASTSYLTTEEVFDMLTDHESGVVEITRFITDRWGTYRTFWDSYFAQGDEIEVVPDGEGHDLLRFQMDTPFYESMDLPHNIPFIVKKYSWRYKSPENYIVGMIDGVDAFGPDQYFKVMLRFI